MEKTLSSYNSTFDSYTRYVDSLKGLESGALYSILGIGGLTAALQAFSKKGFSAATAKLFIKKFAGSIVGLGTAYNLYSYVRTYDKAVKAWNSIPVSYRYW
jgi:hypothetical protein